MRVGIFAGTFDPVHNGHVAFAKEAVERCHLDKIVFLPEREPRGKQAVTTLHHRAAMLQLAVTGNPQFEVLEFPELHFTVAKTLPSLRHAFPGAQLVFLFGSDVATHLRQWPGAASLLANAEVAVGLRMGDKAPEDLPATIIPTSEAHIAASYVRQGQTTDIAPAVRDYIAKHKLYTL